MKIDTSTLLILGSAIILSACNPTASEKEKPNNPIQEEKNVLRLKPLSTEKTHEGGLDTTKLIIPNNQ
jgi:hypothetical protein